MTLRFGNSFIFERKKQYVNLQLTFKGKCHFTAFKFNLTKVVKQ